MYLDTKIGIINFTAYMPVTVIIISSFDIPASINFKFDAASVPENPNYYNIIHIYDVKNVLLKCTKNEISF